MKIPFITTEQMVEVDRAMIEDYKILLVQMMENAGRNLADLARRRFLDGSPAGKRVVVLAGKGGNGGGGLVCARRLHNWGTEVAVYLTAEDTNYSGIPAHQLDILRRMKVAVYTQKTPEKESADLVIDAVIGYSLSGNPRGRAAVLINETNKLAENHDVPVLSLDVPSGIDTTSGRVHEPAIQATATMTLALPKEGLRGENVRSRIGELYLADISVPPTLYRAPALGLEVGALFAKEDIVRVW